MKNIKAETNKFYSFKLRLYKEKIQGYVINQSDEWILIKILFSDYIISGYSLINVKFIENISRNEHDIFTENVLKVNNRLDSDGFEIPLLSVDLFPFLTQQQTIFELHMRKDSVLYVGSIYELREKSFRFNSLYSTGIWYNNDSTFRLDSIRMLVFDSDYVKALVTYSKTLTH